MRKGGPSFLTAVKGSYRHENTERMAASPLPTPELAAQYADWLDTFRGHSKARDAANWAMADLIAEACGSAWKKDPGSGVIGVEKGPLIPLV